MLHINLINYEKDEKLIDVVNSDNFGRQTNKRIGQIDILNGIGIIFVVLGHYSTYMQYTSWSDWIWSWHMPLFFLSGGYLFALKEDMYYEQGYKTYIKRQAQNLLLPYAIFFFISFVTMYVLMPFLRGGGMALTLEEIKKIIVAFLLSGGFLETVGINNFPLWFFSLYFIAKIVYYLLIRLKRVNVLIYMTCIILIVGITIPFQQVVSGRPIYHINVLPVAIVFMAIGNIFYHVKGKTILNIEIADFVKELVACICIYAGMVIAYCYPGNVGDIGSLLYIVGACSTVFGLYVFSGYNKGVILSFLGRNSVIILGLHSLVGGLFRNFVEQWFMIKWEGPLINFIYVSWQLFLLSIICLIWSKLKSLFMGYYSLKRRKIVR